MQVLKFKFKHFQLFLIISMIFLDMVAYSFILPFLPNYSEKLNLNDSSYLGFLVASYAIGLCLAIPLAGYIISKTRENIVILIGATSLCASLILFAHSSSFPMLMSARFLQGLSAAFTWTCGLAIASQLFSVRKRGKALGWVMAGTAFGQIVGAPLGGFLYSSIGEQSSFWIISALCLISGLLCFYFLRPNALVHADSTLTNDLHQPIFPLFLQIIKNMRVCAVLVVVFLEATAFSLLEPLLPLQLSKEYGLKTDTIGVMFGLLIVSYAILSPVSAYIADRIGKTKTVVSGMVLSCISMMFLAQSQNIYHYGFFLMILGASFSLFISPTLTLLADAADKTGARKSYGIVYSVYNEVYAIGMMVGPSLGGLILVQNSASTCLTLCAVTLSILTPFAALFFKMSQQPSSASTLEIS